MVITGFTTIEVVVPVVVVVVVVGLLNVVSTTVTGVVLITVAFGVEVAEDAAFVDVT